LIRQYIESGDLEAFVDLLQYRCWHKP
jgi:hypothetical protein